VVKEWMAAKHQSRSRSADHVCSSSGQIMPVWLTTWRPRAASNQPNGGWFVVAGDDQRREDVEEVVSTAESVPGAPTLRFHGQDVVMEKVTVPGVENGL
jgi:hypothetical protein